MYRLSIANTTEEFKKTMLTKRQKEVWCQNLRSGLYPQTTGLLRDYSGFCCLGVLCDLENPNGWTDSTWSSLLKFEGSITHAPSRLLEDTIQDELISMNDSGKTFSEIAYWIERNVETIDPSRTVSPMRRLYEMFSRLIWRLWSWLPTPWKLHDENRTK